MLLLRLCILGCVVGFAAAFAQDTRKPVAVVNGVPIEQQAFDQLLQQSLKQGNRDTAQLRQRVRDQLVARELFLQEQSLRSDAGVAPGSDRGLTIPGRGVVYVDRLRGVGPEQTLDDPRHCFLQYPDRVLQ